MATIDGIGRTVSGLFEGPAVSRLVYAVARLRRLWRNRGHVRYLQELSDWELADIGLLREDVEHARSLPLTVDPTLRLQALVQARQRCETVIRKP
ncbi:DUF1127 domain-containing protein [Aquibium sp. A9E412]|uniref:DUF1127 domain-containing protein n=1 Tax=Aquibium sp. A9E412 TaxID=2976767 RepID=UPI0025B16A3C|nr:DUF1127 domain-containing protein [Aquibium sp. A9E412]MDN2566969.1 DUF1127 domain-containing protein [Aquibium sp. A9E412]